MLRYAVSIYPPGTIPISSQGICNQFQKENTRGVLYNPGAGEIGCHARFRFFQASGDHTPPFRNPDRSFRPVWARRGPPLHVVCKLNWYCVWYVVELVLVLGVEYRGLMTAGNTQISPPSSSSFGIRTATGVRSNFQRWLARLPQRACYTSSLSLPCRSMSKSL